MEVALDLQCRSLRDGSHLDWSDNVVERPQLSAEVAPRCGFSGVVARQFGLPTKWTTDVTAAQIGYFPRGCFAGYLWWFRPAWGVYT